MQFYLPVIVLIMKEALMSGIFLHYLLKISDFISN